LGRPVQTADRVPDFGVPDGVAVLDRQEFVLELVPLRLNSFQEIGHVGGALARFVLCRKGGRYLCPMDCRGSPSIACGMRMILGCAPASPTSRRGFMAVTDSDRQYLTR